MLSIINIYHINLTHHTINLERPGHTVALLTDARRTHVLTTWTERPHEKDYLPHLYAIFDQVGGDGWIVGPPSWFNFDNLGTAVRLNDHRFPMWITSAVDAIDDVEPELGSSGYTNYQLRRPQG